MNYIFQTQKNQHILGVFSLSNFIWDKAMQRIQKFFSGISLKVVFVLIFVASKS